jgi:pilus assembly protein CpaE
MPVYLLQATVGPGVQAAVVQRLKAAIPGLVETASLESILKSGAHHEDAERPIALVVAPQGDRTYFDQVVEFADRYGKSLALVLIGEEISATDYKRLVRSGAADWVSATAPIEEVIEVVDRLRRGSASSSTVRVSANRPVTILFVPSAGGVGNATLIVETAALLSADKATQRKVCIVDLDFQTSHVCDFLDGEARLNIAEFASAPERLDAHLFESFRTHHASGIDVFAAPRSKFASEILDVHALDALFSMIATRYDLVLIDHPLMWSPWTPQIIAASDGAVITCVNTIPCLRQASETLSRVRASGPTLLQLTIVINRCQRGMLGSVARRKHVEMAFPEQRLFFIGERPEAVESVNMGIPMMLGSFAGRVRKEFAPLAEFCGGLKSSRAFAT